MKMFVDDIRKAPKGWLEIRTITSAIRILSTMDVEVIALDHDIQHWKGSGDLILPTVECTEDFTAVAWAITLMPKERHPKEVMVHSANPEAFSRIKGILGSFEIKVTRVFYTPKGDDIELVPV